MVHNWIKNNYKYNSKSWEFDITAKRIIALLSNYHLTYENSDKAYQDNFNGIIQKQANHLIQEINKSKSIEDKDYWMCIYNIGRSLLSRRKKLSFLWFGCFKESYQYFN